MHRVGYTQKANLSRLLGPAITKRSCFQRASRAWRQLLVLAGLAIVACSPQLRNSSEESRTLQDRLVPDMNRWSQGSSPIYSLHKHPAVRSFDYLCAVAEYESHSKIETELPFVREYRGTTGDVVPEINIAIIGVKGSVAHVAYLKRDPLTIYGARVRCHRARKAVLTRQIRKETTLPFARLEEYK